MLNPVLFHDVFQAWQQCAKHKRAGRQAQRFEIHLLDELISLTTALDQGTWQPCPPVSFILNQTKPREIHAAEFKDRVVHHYLVPRLSELYEPVFIHDVYSNRLGKGTHLAVKRLARYMRQQRSKATLTERPSANSGYYLQLDIKNFFNSIDKAKVFMLLQHRLRKAVSRKKVTMNEAVFLRELCYRILKQNTAAEARNIAKPFELNRVPEHKKLISSGPNIGLAIGNLSSQFFANVLLNELDQFVKHTLKCKYYLRYVDDFVLLHSCPKQLDQWRTRIHTFLQHTLNLQLRDQGCLQPVSNGVDFLGYIVRPDYQLVRRRVVSNCREKLKNWQHRHIQGSLNVGWHIHVNALEFEQLNSTLASYLGHFSHAKHHNLIRALCQSQFPWLCLLFDFRKSRQGHITISSALAPKSVNSYASQRRWCEQSFPNAQICLQKGYKVERIKANRPLIVPQPPISQPTVSTKRLFFEESMRLRHQCESVNVVEVGYLKGGLKKRQINRLRTRALPPKNSTPRITANIAQTNPNQISLLRELYHDV